MKGVQKSSYCWFIKSWGRVSGWVEKSLICLYIDIETVSRYNLMNDRTVDRPLDLGVGKRGSVHDRTFIY